MGGNVVGPTGWAAGILTSFWVALRLQQCLGERRIGLIHADHVIAFGDVPIANFKIARRNRDFDHPKLKRFKQAGQGVRIILLTRSHKRCRFLSLDCSATDAIGIA